MVLGAVYMSVSVWEALLKPGLMESINIDYLTALWGITMPMTVSIPVVLYLVFQYEHKKTYSWKEAGYLVILLAGCYMFYGVLEDFGCYIIWGVAKTFNPTVAYWHVLWFYDIFPVYYFMAVPGIIMIIWAFLWSRQNYLKLIK